MSRFFNETRKTFKQNAAPGHASVNLDEAVDAMRISVNAERQPQIVTNPAAVPSLSTLQESSEIASEISALRLAKCRSIRLPRDDQKSFLSAQYNPSMQAAVEAYRSLRTRLVRRQTEMTTHSLAITSAEPGDGKTLTAFNLALCYANIQNWAVLLVDADLRTRGLSRIIGDPESPGLGQILESGCQYQSAILSTNVPRLHVLPAGISSTAPPELFSSAAWNDFIGWSTETFRLVIIDSPPILDLADFELIATPCESTLLIARARKTRRESLTRARAMLDPRKLVGVVVNSADESQNLNYYYHRYQTTET